MRRISATQQTLTWMVTAVTLLAVAVLLWGTAYKCSLYHRHPDEHVRIARVKLIVDEESPAVKRVAAPLRSRTAPFSFIVVALLLRLPDRHARSRPTLPSSTMGSASLLFCLSRFFLRPPPLSFS